MSADNGIYILETKDSYRVTHAQAIENLFYSHIGFHSCEEIVPTRAIEIFGGCKFTRDKEKALKIAHDIEQGMYTEYGVRIFSTYKSWKQMVNEAKDLAKKELKYLMENEREDSWRKYQIKKLETIIQKYK